MKNRNTSLSFLFSFGLKLIARGLKNLFESGNNKDFKRLKDFISS